MVLPTNKREWRLEKKVNLESLLLNIKFLYFKFYWPIMRTFSFLNLCYKERNSWNGNSYIQTVWIVYLIIPYVYIIVINFGFLFFLNVSYSKEVKSTKWKSLMRAWAPLSQLTFWRASFLSCQIGQVVFITFSRSKLHHMQPNLFVSYYVL